MLSPDSQISPSTPAVVPDTEATHPWPGEEPQIDENGNEYYSDVKRDPDPTDPADLKVVNAVDPTRVKRNSGRTGATTPIGKAISARNATRHGMCAKTLILDNESEEDWLKLLNTLLADYQNPAEDTYLYTLVVKTVQEEWYRLRIQREFDLFYASMDGAPLPFWPAEQQKMHQLMTRYLNGAKRGVAREKRLLDQHYKLHGPPVAKQEQPQPEPPPPDAPPVYCFINNDTGESLCEGKLSPPPPGYKPEPIIPGVFPPNHPAHWGDRQQKRKP